MSSSNPTLDINYLQSLFPDESESFFNNYKGLTDFVPALVFVVDAEQQRIAYTNKQFKTLLGYEEEDIYAPDFTWQKIIFKEDVEAFDKELKKCLELKDDDSYTYSNRLNHKQGEWKYFRTKAKVLRRNSEGKAGALLFVAEDITAQMRDTEELQRTRQLVSETERMHRFGIYTYDVPTDTFNWSDGIYMLFDVDRASNPSPNYAFFKNFIVPDDAERMEDLRSKISKETTEYENIYSIQTEKGDIKIFLDIVKIMRNDNGEIIKYIGSLRDITKERLFERELQKNIKDLNSSNKELEEFAYVASHDMQEPLRKITTFSTRLQAKFKDQLGDEGKNYLERMNVAANNMRTLIENLLEISKTSRQDHPFKLVDLKTILIGTLNELELSIEENEVTINIINSLPQIEAVAPLIHQLFSNLINNSIKFRSNRKPVININCSKIGKNRREQLLLPEKVFYELTLTDNGIGFEQEFAERVFQLFQRLHGKAEYPGSGIGLSICKKIVEKHNGIIYAESAVNNGTTFYIILPEKQ
jgi:PAS domain S-box-containing protein